MTAAADRKDYRIATELARQNATRLSPAPKPETVVEST
jgi:hypothetical protein